MSLFVAAIALVQAAPAAPSTFSPPVDRAITLTIEQRRTSSGTVRRYVAHHRIVFAREATGWRARIIVTRIEQDAGSRGRDFAAAAGIALVNRPLVFHLDPAGTILSLDAADDAWSAVLAGVAAIPHGAGFAAPLRALPPEARLAMLAEPLAGLVAGDDASTPAGERPVTLPAGPPLGRGSTLAGTRLASRGADGRVTLRTTARGARDGMAIELARLRVIDPALGLVVGQRETTTITLAGAVRIVEQITTLTL